MKLSRISFLALVCLMFSSLTCFATIKDTKHNLSTSGPGSTRASQESQICIFCHTPHNSRPNGPLWNRSDPGQNYTLYKSSTKKATLNQPTGASILCLSCHDGTIALGKVTSRQSDIAMRGGTTTMPVGSTNLDTDLSDDHPISFDYASALQTNGELRQPSALTGAVKLDANGELQCTSCHNAHDNTNGKFLVLSNRGGQLCETCHTKYGWSQTPHNLSSKTWNGSTPDPWPDSDPGWITVADNACQNCHQPHSANSGERLLKSNVEEEVCTACHNGHVASKDIMAEFNKSSFHPLSTGTHDPSESVVVSARHVECVDCHNPHAAKASGTPAGPLTGVRGVHRTGNLVNPIAFEYELCFRCHGDSSIDPRDAPTQRVFTTTNVRQEFATSNGSYHPVVRAGQNSNVPSLISSLSTNSIIKCTDCHSNNSGPGAGGNGPKGPHGSIYSHLLERQNLKNDPTSESASAYALCYKCHNRSSILGNQSFSRHSFHINGQGRMAMMGGGMMGGLSTPCNVCHDPHASGYQKLINFDTSVVSPANGGPAVPQFNSTGTFAGQCYLNCHGMNHNPCTYGPGTQGGMGMGCMGGMGGGGGGGH